MSTKVQLRRETASFLSTYVGAQGEVLVDTTNNRVQVHDGSTPGGWAAAKLAEIEEALQGNASITAAIAAEVARAMAAEASATTGARIIQDASYAAAAADLGVLMLTLTTPRTITLPSRASMATMKPFPVADESGNASPASPITIVAAPGDTINGSASNTLVIESAYGIVTPRPGVTTWIYG